jgi:hypothetical protein
MGKRAIEKAEPRLRTVSSAQVSNATCRSGWKQKPAFADECRFDWAPWVADGWVLKPLGNGGVEAQFLILNHALEWMLLGQARSCARIDPFWPGQSLHMTWGPGQVGQG